MSHSVTVTRTTTTSTARAVLLNTGYFSSAPGLLRLTETILGAVCLGIISYYTSYKGGVSAFPEQIFFFLTVFAVLFTTFLLLIACLFNISTSSFVPKTLFETLFHWFCFIFYLAAALTLLIRYSERKNRYKGYRAMVRTDNFDAMIAAAVLGLINCALYLVSAIFSTRSYRMT